MITFDNLTLNAFYEEQKEFIIGARINKIQQPTRREFLITLRNLGETKQLYININPQMYHICVASKENITKRELEIPKSPPMFCMLLRKYLENSKIAKLECQKGERILEFYIETYNELKDKIFLCLAIELMGKHSNIILYNTDTGIILGCAHNVGADKSREREIYGGIPYTYPPQQKQLTKTWDSLIEKVKPQTNVNDLIDNYYANIIAVHKYNMLKNNYKAIVTQKLKKINKSIAQINNKLLSNSDSDKFRLWGDLIMANLYNLPDYSSKIEVFDYENNKQIELKLDKNKTLKENANRFYRQYTKAKSANSKINELIEKYTQDKQYIEQLLYSINSAKTIDDLKEISPEVEHKKEIKKTKQQIDIPKIEFENGTRIYIGKNNKQNDYIISKLASDDDLWFHTHNCAGSHVLLKTQNLTDELILKCAKLAKENSSAKDSSKIGVIYTKRKYLRKPPAANLGYVTYKNEKEIIID
ncbi:MAG: fibronectin/fibrinogen-binding protein [Cyanobacteria bacterium SIG26]|nr:fibronectin/fibrinogen-binding protein [Cyanobacteria bacterium SIG26]